MVALAVVQDDYKYVDAAVHNDGDGNVTLWNRKLEGSRDGVKFTIQNLHAPNKI